MQGERQSGQNCLHSSSVNTPRGQRALLQRTSCLAGTGIDASQLSYDTPVRQEKPNHGRGFFTHRTVTLHAGTNPQKPHSRAAFARRDHAEFEASVFAL